MTSNSRTVSVDRAALQSLKASLAEEREAARRLSSQLATEAEVTRRALEETLSAREERDEFRRVLAASSADAARADAERNAIREVNERLEVTLRAAERARGEAEGRARKLEEQLEALGQSHEQDLARAQDRAWADTEAKSRELMDERHRHGVTRGELESLRREAPGQASEAARLAEARKRAALWTAGVCAGFFLMLVIPLGEALVYGEGDGWPAFASRLGPWPLIVIEVVLAASVVGLLHLALQERRAVEREHETDKNEGSSDLARVEA